MKKKNTLYIVILAVILIACLWAFISAAIITKNFKKDLLNPDLFGKEVAIKGVLITETKEGQKHWEIYADTGNYEGEEDFVVLKELTGNIYENNEVCASFESSKGTYDTKTKVITLYEKTLIVYKDGSNMRADKIIWSGKNKDIVAAGNVVIEKPKEAKIYGNKAIASPDLTFFKVEGKTKTEIFDKNFAGKGK